MGVRCPCSQVVLIQSGVPGVTLRRAIRMEIRDRWDHPVVEVRDETTWGRV